MFVYIRFNDDPTLEKKMLPQYDDPAVDEVSMSRLFPTFSSEPSFISFIFIPGIFTSLFEHCNWF